MNHHLILAAVNGTDIIHQLVALVIVIVCALIVYGLGRWMFGAFKTPPVVMTVWNGLFILLGALVAINFLLSLIGHPLITF